ncbi:MAG: methyltransferase domain-containing protein, partial [Desulfosarcinaceae bacterium]
FKPQTFDDAFVCFVLEHLPEPEKALICIKDMLKPGGRLTLIEGDHGSWYCHPETPAARRTVECLIKVQAAMQGDALIGRRLYPLLRSSGFRQVQVVPRMVYVDQSRPGLVEGFSRNTFIAMVAAVEDQAVDMGLIGREDWRRGINDLYRATGPEGTFCYTFFKARAEKGS